MKNLWCIGLGAGFILILICLCAFAFCLYHASSRVASSLPHSMETADNMVHDMSMFVESILQQADMLVYDDLKQIFYTIAAEIKDCPNAIMKAFFGTTSGLIDPLLTGLQVLPNVTEDLINYIESSNKTLTDIKTEGTALNDATSQIRSEIIQVKDDCKSDYPTQPQQDQICGRLLDGDSFPDTFDFSSMPTFDPPSNLVDQLKAVNWSSAYDQVKKAIDQVPRLVKEKAGNTTSQVAQQVKDVYHNISDMYDDARVMVKEVTDIPTLKQIPRITEEARQFLEEFGYDQKVLISTILLATLVLVVVVIGVVGVVLGALSYKAAAGNPAIRSPMGHKGSRVVYCSCCCSALLVGQFFFGSILFLLGVHLTVICQPMIDLSFFDEVLDNPKFWGTEKNTTFINDAIFGAKVGDLIRGCRDNKAPYKIMKLYKVWNLTETFQENVNLSAYMPDLMKVADEFSPDVNVMSDQEKQDLQNALDEADFKDDPHEVTANMTDGLQKLFEDDIPNKIRETVSDTPAGFPDSYKDRYLVLADDMETAMNDHARPLNQSIYDLRDILLGIQKMVAVFRSSIDLILQAVAGIEATLLSDTKRIILDAIDAFLYTIDSFLNQFITHVTRGLMEDIGACQPMWDIYSGFIGTMCYYFLDGFNALWLAMCMVGIFMIFGMVLACQLPKYFQMPEDYDPGMADGVPRKNSMLFTNPVQFVKGKNRTSVTVTDLD